MRKNNLTIAITLIFVVCAGPSQAASRISAEVDSKADATLTAAEQRAVSVAAGRLLRHTYDARVALEAKDKKQAAIEMDQMQILVAIIEQAVPTYTVKSQITAGDLSYEHEDSVKPTLIPIFDELDKVSLVAPLRQAKTEKDKAATKDDNQSAEVVASVDEQEVQVSLDIAVAKAGIDVARSELADDNLAGAEQALAAVLGSLHYTLLDVGLPLDQARENLMLAKTAIENNDLAESKAALAEARRELEAYSETADEADRIAISGLRDEIKSLDRKLEAGKDYKGIAATIEDWWDRIGKLIR